MKMMGGPVDGCAAYTAQIDDGFFYAIGREIGNSEPVRIRKASDPHYEARILDSCFFGQYSDSGKDCDAIVLQGAQNVMIRGYQFGGGEKAGAYNAMRIEDDGLCSTRY
ncbi:MAG: hypothetical protein DRQ24_08750 [Candidatus Latescibacterota bacterium]|nr:MAG: hypothetical protein DRQ24_08750 [Candidatus Latescibacterota bacterium]